MNKSIYISVLLASFVVGAVSAETPDAGASPKAASAKAWSPYQPAKAPELPAVKQKAWVRSPVDAFVLSQIEAKGLKPSPEADRATFIRRATLDAWGLLPTPEEIKAFVNDKSPNAYHKLVDPLLAPKPLG